MRTHDEIKIINLRDEKIKARLVQNSSKSKDCSLVKQKLLASKTKIVLFETDDKLVGLGLGRGLVLRMKPLGLGESGEGISFFLIFF